MKYLLVIFALLLAPPAHAGELQDALPNPYPAPEFAGIQAWLNTGPLTMAGLKGKVVLVDVWTYSCINCIRTLPYLVEWNRKYRDKGLVIVGVHSPEFPFEAVKANVEAAAKKYFITYPVALDNERKTWDAFKNRYWPAHYLIDRQGRVVYKHFGEGKYDVTENNIRVLLGLNKETLSPGADVVSGGQTPETYLGTARAKNFIASGEPALHQWALTGAWERQADRIVSQERGATLKLHFYAGKVFLVLGTKDGKPVNATLTLNGKPLAADAGGDAPGGVLTVGQHALYELVKQAAPAEGLLEIKAEGARLEAYAFTFGR